MKNEAPLIIPVHWWWAPIHGKLTACQLPIEDGVRVISYLWASTCQACQEAGRTGLAIGLSLLSDR